MIDKLCQSSTESHTQIMWGNSMGRNILLAINTKDGYNLSKKVHCEHLP